MAMSTHRFIVNGTEVEVEVEDDVRLLWVLRDLLGITGPKYGCGLSICQSCTSHINGEVFNPCAVPVGDLKPRDHITTIEGLADTFDGADLHPVQQVWIDEDVAQCGFCQPGQIMAAVGLIEEARRKGREITDQDLDALRNVCRCGTYPRVRTAIRKAAAVMASLPPTPPNGRGEGSGGPGTEGGSDAGAAPVADVDATDAGTAVAAGSGAAQPVRLDGDALASGSDARWLGPAVAAAGTAVAVRSLRRRAEAPAIDADPDGAEST
jgi:isoquinoline 1-oxidoreductase subunit alpha